MAFSSVRLGLGLELAQELTRRRIGLSWSDEVLPFGLARDASTSWSLTGASREVRLLAAG